MAASSLIFGLVALAPLAISREHGGTLVHSRFRLGEGDGAHAKAISDHHGRMLDNKNERSKKKQDKKKREKQNKGPSKSRGNQRAPSANGQQAISRPSAMAPIPRPNRAPWSEAISLPQRPSLGFADSSITPRPTPRPTQRTRRPTPSPTEAPSNSPTSSPSASPSHAPTSAPTTSPTGQPTERPTSAPSSSPTAAPTPLQYCPPAYDPSKTDYVAGDLVEVESHIFVCNDGQDESGEYLYERYCSIDDENSPLESEAEFELWDNAWPYVSACYRTDTPTASPTTGEPTTTPSVAPSNEPSIVPSSEPSIHHSDQPSLEPSIHHSDQPSIHHSDQPSIAKSGQPSMEPSVNPTSYPSDSPSGSPTDQPTKSPSHSPTSSPSKSPTLHPTDAPTTSPTISQFWYPDVYSEENVCTLGANFPHWMEFTTNADNYLFRSEADCCDKHGCDIMGGVRVVPTQSPSLHPTTYPPSKGPTDQPTDQPTKSPTASPTTPSPTANPTASPSKSPSSSPTGAPTNEPTHLATASPTTAPTTDQPSTAPSHAPSPSPTGQPIANSAQGTIPPTNSPTVIATSSPTSTPTQVPTSSPSKPPSNSPIATPICPDAYQLTSVYRAGSEVEVDQKIYRCKDYPWAFYCSQPNFRPQGPDSTEWQDAWSEEGPCEKAPSASPTLHPTPSPTRPITTRSPTNKPTPVPTPPPTTKQPTLSPTPDPQYTMFPYPYPHTRFTQWTKLSNQDKTTVYLLGYERSSWDNLQISSLESYPFSELDLVEQSAVKALGMNENQWDCFVNHYNGLYWSELEDEGVAQYYVVLGWSQNSWDNEVDVPDTESMSWDQLSASQREAARNLCYSKNAWDWVALPYW